MKITEEWLKEQGWEVNHYDLPVELNNFKYATKMFGKDMAIWNETHNLKIFRDYEEPCDVYADVLIDNIDTAEKLYQSLDLCGLYNFKEYDWLYENWLDKACRWLVEHTHDAAALGNITCTSVMTEGRLIEDFCKAMGKKTNPIFERALANVNPETRAEIRKNMDAVANCDQSKARQYSENRILAIPADVNEDGEVFYLNSDLGTADDEYNGLSGEIELAYDNGYGQALLDNKNPWHKASEELPYRNGIYLIRGVYENLTKDIFYSTSAYDAEYGKFINYPSYGIITHWMPIPEIKED